MVLEESPSWQINTVDGFPNFQFNYELEQSEKGRYDMARIEHVFITSYRCRKIKNATEWCLPFSDWFDFRLKKIEKTVSTRNLLEDEALNIKFAKSSIPLTIEQFSEFFSIVFTDAVFVQFMIRSVIPLSIPNTFK